MWERNLATVAVGDIHGNLLALDDLLSKLTSELGPADEVVFLGDYIDRGPDSRGCIDRIIKLRREAPFSVVTLMGNHEEWMLRTYRNPTSHSWILGMEALDTISSYSPGAALSLRHEIEQAGIRLITERVPLPYELFYALLPESHLEFFKTLRQFHRSPSVICVHGGLDPAGGPVETQDADSLIWGTHGFPDAYLGQDPIVYGHRNNAILDDTGWPWPCVGKNKTFGIDTISQGVLTAMSFPDGKVFQSQRYSINRQTSQTR